MLDVGRLLAATWASTVFVSTSSLLVADQKLPATIPAGFRYGPARRGFGESPSFIREQPTTRAGRRVQ